ncbi:MAG: hypothetical protein J6U44_07495 [Paludibacteraceae bacterium]|nr:hypothetical protein [Paludibacteraceae bacterium]
MKKQVFIVFALASLFLVACNGNKSNNNGGGVAFNPDATEKKISDEERERLLAEKKAKYNAENDFSSATYESTEGWVKLSVYIPEVEKLDAGIAKQIEQKTLQIITTNGIGGLYANPRFIIVPEATVLSKEAISTAPVKYLVNYDVTFYIGDILTGTVFGSTNLQLKGVGESDQLAFTNAFKSVDPKSAKMQSFVAESQQKLIEFFKREGENMINDAKRCATQENYTEAMALLSAIPSSDSIHYPVALELMNTYFNQHIAKEGCNILALMKSALGQSTYGEVNTLAMEYYAMIPANSPHKKEADMVFNEYKKQLSAEQQQAWNAEQKRIDKQQDADNEFRKIEASEVAKTMRTTAIANGIAEIGKGIANRKPSFLRIGGIF